MTTTNGDYDGSEKQQVVPSPTPPRRRNKYTLEFKLKVANEYVPGDIARGSEALARQYGLHKSIVMAWVAKKDLMAERLAAKGGSSAGRHSFRLDRKLPHSALEDELERWIQQQSVSGERIRDKDVKEKAMCIYLDMHGGVAPTSGPHIFKASSGWLAGFKNRKNVALHRASRGDGSDDAPVAATQLPVAQPVTIAPRPPTTVSVASVASITPAVIVAGQREVMTAGSKRLATTTTTTVATTPTASMTTPSAPTTTTSQSANPAAAAVPLDVSAIPTAWIASVDRRLGDLAHQLEHLVNGQNLLLGMLQRLTPLALPSVPPVAIAPAEPSGQPIGSLCSVNGDATNTTSSDETVAAAAATSVEAAPAAKRRRAS